MTTARNPGLEGPAQQLIGTPDSFAPGFDPESLRSYPPGFDPESLRSYPPGFDPESLRSYPPA